MRGEAERCRPVSARCRFGTEDPGGTKSGDLLLGQSEQFPGQSGGVGPEDRRRRRIGPAHPGSAQGRPLQ